MTGRRGLLWGGVLCIVAGLVLVGYVGWQLVGTNIVSERRQGELVEQVERQWAGPDEGSTTLDADALVRIPRFGDDYVMPVLDGVTDDNLSRGLAHFPDSAGPGETGNYALAGHRITHGQPLRNLPELEPGDQVLVETRDTVFVYEVDTDPNDLVVGFDEGWVLADHPVNPDPDGVAPAPDARLLTLTTCAELFHTDERMVVFGHLVDTQAK